MAELLTFDEGDVQEEFFARNWTDGLPIVPPTPARVEALLEFAGVDGAAVIGDVPQRSRSITAEKAAINAVMAGARPEYFPVVLAALSAMLDPPFNANTVITSTGGAALCAVVSGPFVRDLGFATQHNALGAGNRANATVGRALRLTAMNVLGARSPGMDGSSIGHPGKYTMVLAEDAPPSPWPPLRVELGYSTDDTTVTMFGAEGVHQIANHLNEDPIGILRSYAAAMKCPTGYLVGKGGQMIVVIGPEHALPLLAGGWTKPAIREFLAGASRVTPEELAAGGILLEVGSQHNMVPDADNTLPTAASPDDIFLVTAGGAGAGWSAYIPVWAPKLHSQACTRRVMPRGAGLPDR